jgi:DUF971 family protein
MPEEKLDSTTGIEQTTSKQTTFKTNMRPLDIQPIGQELAIKWEDGTESFVSLERLRRACPCAGCKGEMDIFGHLYKNPDKPLPPQAFELVRIEHVGGYALQPVWGDRHASGLFSYDYLKRVAG